MKNKLKVGCFVYELREMDDADTDFSGKTGNWDSCYRVIYYHSVPDLLHEICHAIDDFMSITSGEVSIEEYADKTSHGLLMVLRDNPWLADVLVGKK